MSENDNEFVPTVEAVIKETSRITDVSTDEVRHIVLQVDDPSFRYLEGQSIGVMVTGPDEFGNKYHLRRYSIANNRQMFDESGIELTILVRRCFYIDEVNGERYPGIASNFLCDAAVGDKISITGPYKSPFNMPDDSRANLLMIGTGTGIAPFRAFIQHIYKQKGGWEGRVRLFYGAKTGLDLLYMNDKNNDLATYFDEDTFQAYNAIAGRPLTGDEKALEDSLKENAQEVWELMQQPNTYVFIAGLSKLIASLDKVMIEVAGSEQAWRALKQKMISHKRWSELFYS